MQRITPDDLVGNGIRVPHAGTVVCQQRRRPRRLRPLEARFLLNGARSPCRGLLSCRPRRAHGVGADAPVAKVSLREALRLHSQWPSFAQCTPLRRRREIERPAKGPQPACRPSPPRAAKGQGRLTHKSTYAHLRAAGAAGFVRRDIVELR